jgi:hypothetical protein
MKELARRATASSEAACICRGRSDGLLPMAKADPKKKKRKRLRIDPDVISSQRVSFDEDGAPSCHFEILNATSTVFSWLPASVMPPCIWFSSWCLSSMRCTVNA